MSSDLSKLRVLVDCANGAATAEAPELFRSLGVQATFIHVSPDGKNINEGCGALASGNVGQEWSRESAGKFDLGVTFDGDADRALFCDAAGRVVNGDGVLLAAARDLHAQGKLKADTVVSTTMSNMGLEIALKNSGIRMLRANVGDKYVLEEMLKTGATLGGEQSGHIIFRDGDATTGDGLLTALRLMDIIVRAGKPLADLVGDLKVLSPENSERARAREDSLRPDPRSAGGNRQPPNANSTATAASSSATPAPRRWPESWSKPNPKKRCAPSPPQSPPRFKKPWECRDRPMVKRRLQVSCGDSRHVRLVRRAKPGLLELALTASALLPFARTGSSSSTAN